MVCNYTHITKPNRHMSDCKTYGAFKMSKSETAILNGICFLFLFLFPNLIFYSVYM